MKVFISWSGPQSKALAEILRAWLPQVLNAVEPFFSEEDIRRGDRWSHAIAGQLMGTSVGLILITPDGNAESPWLIFEAGALSKNLKASKVCPILFGLSPANVTGPLTTFQMATFSEKQMREVVGMMNAELSSPLEPQVLIRAFDKWWPDLEAEVGEALKAQSLEKPPQRTDRELLEEVLNTVRGLVNVLGGPEEEAQTIELLRSLGMSYAQLAKDLLAHAKAGYAPPIAARHLGKGVLQLLKKYEAPGNRIPDAVNTCSLALQLISAAQVAGMEPSE